MDLSTFELLGGIGAGLVVFGVLLESSELLIKVAKKRGARTWIEREGSRRCVFSLICLARRMRPIMLWVEGLSLGIVIAGLAIEWFGTSGADRIQSATNGQLVLQIASLKEKATENEKQIFTLSNANSQASIELSLMYSNNLILQSNILELISVQEPRMIAQTAPMSALSKFAGIHAEMVVLDDRGDCVRVGVELSEILQAAHWNVDDVVLTENPVPSGISIGICSTNDVWTEGWHQRNSGSPLLARMDIFERKHPSGMTDDEISNLENACDALASELNKQNVIPNRNEEMNRLSNWRFNGVLIWVGPKPSVLEAETIEEQAKMDNLEKQIESQNFNQPFNNDLENEMNAETKKFFHLLDEPYHLKFGTNGWGNIGIYQPKLP